VCVDTWRENDCRAKMLREQSGDFNYCEFGEKWNAPLRVRSRLRTQSCENTSITGKSMERVAAQVDGLPPCRQSARERERTLCSLTAERQMNGDCVCVCMCRAARCEWRLGNTTFVWLRPTRGAARVGSSAHQQRQSSLPSAALPQPSFLCLSSICWSDRRGSLARSFASSNRARPRALLLKH
jgi:hypothetical protein